MLSMLSHYAWINTFSLLTHGLSVTFLKSYTRDAEADAEEEEVNPLINSAA